MSNYRNDHPWLWRIQGGGGEAEGEATPPPPHTPILHFFPRHFYPWHFYVGHHHQWKSWIYTCPVRNLSAMFELIYILHNRTSLFNHTFLKLKPRYRYSGLLHTLIINPRPKNENKYLQTKNINFGGWNVKQNFGVEMFWRTSSFYTNHTTWSYKCNISSKHWRRILLCPLIMPIRFA